MRTKQLVTGLYNSQSIRIIIQGVAVFIKVKDIPNSFAFPEQRVVIWNALEHLGTQRLQSYGRTYQVYNSKKELTNIDIQVDLL